MFVKPGIRRVFNIVVLFLCFHGLPSVFPQEPESTDNQITVFILHTSSVELPWVDSFNSGLEKIRQENFRTYRYIFEFMSTDFSGNQLDTGDWVEYLHKKYANTQFDFILADGIDAVTLLTENPKLFPDIPKIFRSENLAGNVSDSRLFISSRIKDAVEATASHAVRQNPDAEKVIIVDGGNVPSSNAISSLYPWLENHFSGDLEVIGHFSMDELMESVKGADRNTIIFYTLVFSDSEGNVFVPRDVLKAVTDVSPAPVYSFWSALMNSGTVGGVMLDAETAAQEMLRAGTDYIEQGHYGTDYKTLNIFWDWEALKRYRIPIRDLPDNRIVNKPVSPFVLYYREIITAIAVVALVLFFMTFGFMRKMRLLNRDLLTQKETLQQTLQEKSILIREIDHRVKNNLFILKSLVSLQISNSSDNQVKHHLQDIGNRITALALVHDNICKAEQESVLDIKKYFEDLMYNIYDGMIPDPQKVALKYHIDPLDLSIKTATTCGLIINELLSNALKYAFPGDTTGTITIDIHHKEDTYEIIVQDTGIGMPDDFTIEESSGIGMKIVEQLILQLGGSLEITTGGGTQFRLLFSDTTS